MGAFSELLEPGAFSLRPMTFRSRERTRGLPTTEEWVCPAPAAGGGTASPAALLADTDMPVPARGVARTHVLLTNPASPLHRGAAGELHRQLTQTLFELERGE